MIPIWKNSNRAYQTTKGMPNAKYCQDSNTNTINEEKQKTPIMFNSKETHKKCTDCDSSQSCEANIK